MIYSVFYGFVCVLSVRTVPPLSLGAVRDIVWFYVFCVI